MHRPAADNFAVAMGASGGAGLRPPPGLDTDAYKEVLAIHMAALVAVDTHIQGAVSPITPEQITKHLLVRERRFWHIQEDRAPATTGTSANVLARTVLAAILTGPARRTSALEIVTALQLATDPATAQQILDSHAECYPPADSATLLELIHPDRLAEDLLALATPTPRTSDPSWHDAWVLDAPSRLAAAHRSPAAFALPGRQMVMRLIETARRWPSTAQQHLKPLLTEHPGLARAAGSAALAALADLPTLDIAVLEALTIHKRSSVRHADRAKQVEQHLARLSAPPTGPRPQR